MTKIEQLADKVVEVRKEIPDERTMLAGISGIDASGKGHVSARLDAELKRRGFRTALVNVDGWLNLPEVRFCGSEPGRNFYHNALRLDEMFDRLIIPFKAARSIRITADLVGETATEFHRSEYVFDNIDVIILEGIFLFKPQFLNHFDLKIWIECGFETALKRSVSRSQERLDADATILAYQTIYFPAQRIHFESDEPRSAADIILINDQ